MKKINWKQLLIPSMLFMIILLLSGCGSDTFDFDSGITNEEELNQTILIVKYRNDYYEFERGYYYSYKFTVEDTTNIFIYDIRTWFYSSEKWEKNDVIIVTEENGKLYFLNIGNLNYEDTE